MRYKLTYSHQFQKDVKLCQKRGLNLELLTKAITILASEGSLPASYKPHILHGSREGQWECHIKPNWLMVWEQNDEALTLLMLNTGTHSDLFK